MMHGTGAQTAPIGQRRIMKKQQRVEDLLLVSYSMNVEQRKKKELAKVNKLV